MENFLHLNVCQMHKFFNKCDIYSKMLVGYGKIKQYNDGKITLYYDINSNCKNEMTFTLEPEFIRNFYKHNLQTNDEHYDENKKIINKIQSIKKIENTINYACN